MDQLADDFCKRLCQAASIGIIITDRQFNISMMNLSAARLFGLTPDQVRGKPVVSLVPEYRRGTTEKLLARSSSLGRSVELRFIHNVDARKRHLAILIDPIRSSDGELDGVCLWIRDQTRRMDLERRLAQIEKLASLGQLAGGLAHHLNNVLGGVVTAVDHGLGSKDIGGAKRALELVAKGLANAVKLTRRLLEFSTPELPDHNLVDLTEAVITFVEQEQDRLRQVGRQIEFDIQSAPILAVHQGKFRQILDILLANSEQALGKQGGHIKIVLDADDHEVRISFTDDGPGISERIADQIFEPFFTTRGAMGGGSEGNLGLGLALAHRLAGEIGAALSYCKQQGQKGTCFALDFPLRGAKPTDSP